GTTIGGDGVSYVIQKQWSNADNACVASSNKVPKPTTTKTTTTTTKATTTTTTTKVITETGIPTTTTTTTTIPVPTTTTIPPSNNACYPAYSSTGIYVSGSLVGYNGYNFRLSGTSWVNQGTCNASWTQKCFAAYVATNYARGAQVSYQGYDYTYDGTSWISQGPCA
ncbi:UNVERIFIED_CONTAM: hypothetical protein HDU68_002178, partial [Siphonaria sp. JEL0065]